MNRRTAQISADYKATTALRPFDDAPLDFRSGQAWQAGTTYECDGGNEQKDAEITEETENYEDNEGICLITKGRKHEIWKTLRGNYEADLNHHRSTLLTAGGHHPSTDSTSLTAGKLWARER